MADGMFLKYGCFLLAVLLPMTGFCQGETEDLDVFFEMPIEELMEIPVVISAIRQEQVITKASVPISLITAEDIHYSGLTNLYEILQFTCGIDMIQIDRNHYSLGVRGLHDVFSDRTLTLINGRPADNLIFGGSEFLRIPVLLEDIERIEIIRGPGGAIWGANAFNGVINIITQKPEDLSGVTVSSQWNEFGDHAEFIRYAGNQLDWAWRLSYGYEAVESSSNAMHSESFYSNFPLSPGDFQSNDFRDGSIFDLDVSHSINEDTNLTFGVGHSNKDTGDYGFLTSFAHEDGSWQNSRLYTKLEKTFEDGDSGFIQWSGNFADQDWPSILQYRSYENDIQAQYNFAPTEGHRRSVGLGLNMVRITQHFVTSDLELAGSPFDEQSAGFFLLDRWEASEKWEFEFQGRADWYSETQTDWASRLSAFYALDDYKHHILRISGARAFRTPRSSPREIMGTRLGGLVNLVKPDELNNETIYSLEGGYSAIVNDRLTINTNMYYQRYQDLIGYTVTRTGPAEFHQAENIGGADAYGAEIECLYKADRCHLSGWYGYNEFVPDGTITGENPAQDIRACRPAEHKVGLTGRYFLDRDFVLNVNYKYSSLTSAVNGAGAGADIPEFHRVDLSLTKQFKTPTLDMEIMAGISDVFNQTELQSAAVGRFYYNHETPGRTFFARLQMNF